MDDTYINPFSYWLKEFFKAILASFFNGFMLPLNPHFTILKIFNNLCNVYVVLFVWALPPLIRASGLLRLWIERDRRYSRRTLIRDLINTPALRRHEKLSVLEQNTPKILSQKHSHGFYAWVQCCFIRFKHQYRHEAIQRLKHCTQEEFDSELFFLGFIDAGRGTWMTPPELHQHLERVLASWDQRKQKADGEYQQDNHSMGKQPYFAELDLLGQREAADQRRLLAQARRPAWVRICDRYALKLFLRDMRFLKYPDLGPNVEFLREIVRWRKPVLAVYRERTWDEWCDFADMPIFRKDATEFHYSRASLDEMVPIHYVTYILYPSLFLWQKFYGWCCYGQLETSWETIRRELIS